MQFLLSLANLARNAKGTEECGIPLGCASNHAHPPLYCQLGRSPWTHAACQAVSDMYAWHAPARPMHNVLRALQLSCGSSSYVWCRTKAVERD